MTDRKIILFKREPLPGGATAITIGWPLIAGALALYLAVAFLGS